MYAILVPIREDVEKSYDGNRGALSDSINGAGDG